MKLPPPLPPHATHQLTLASLGNRGTGAASFDGCGTELRPEVRGSSSLALLLLVMSMRVGTASAQVGTCVPSVEPHVATNGVRDFKINVDATAATTLGMATSDIRDAAILAASSWNERGNSGLFRYTGTTPLTDVPSDCSHSVVYVREDCQYLTAEAKAKCGGTQFLIYVNSRTLECTPRTLSNRAVTGAGLDAIGMLMHEFGHTMGVHHPGYGEQALMSNSPINPNWNNGSRVPFQWDLKCTEEMGGTRSLTGRKRSYVTWMGSAATFGASGIGAASAALTDVSGSSYFAAAYPRMSSGVRWDTALDGTWVSAWTYPVEVGGFKALNLREEPTRDYVAYQDRTDTPDMTTFGSTRDTWAVYSDDNWATKIFGRLQHCTSMASWASCSAGATANVAATGAVSTAWLGDISKSVVVWSHLDRLFGGRNVGSHEIRVSIGKLSDTTLVQPTLTSIRSKTAPAVACMEGAIGGYDCILLYVPVTAGGLQLKARRFNAVSWTNRYIASLEPTEHSVADASTANQVTAWWDSDDAALKLLARGVADGQDLSLWTTDDGVLWQWEQLNFEQSLVPPSAVTSWRGTENRVVYAN
ncbi:MAG: hypothetical protein IV100_28670 [Myxococcales bacterium]|nr:hypothetical protein [Myxococcales bacterium]